MTLSLPKTIAAQIIQEFIQAGTLRTGDRLPSMRVLQDHYKTSHTTMVGALGFLEQDGWIVKRHGSGCYVNKQDQNDAPALLGSNTIGFVAPYTESELMLRICSGIERVCVERSYNLVIANSRSSYHVEQQRVAHFISTGCQAVIVVPATRSIVEMEADYFRLQFLDFPIILVDTVVPEQARTQVVFDNYRAGYEMTKALLAEGHQRIAFMDLDDSSRNPEHRFIHPSIRERYHGYVDALRHAEAEYRDSDRWRVAERPQMADPVGAVLPFLKRWRDSAAADRPTAVIALEDAVAVHTLQAAAQLGIDCPGALRITGFDNSAMAQALCPGLPTTNPNFQGAGELAAQLAVRLIDKTIVPQHSIYVLPVPIKMNGKVELTPDAQPPEIQTAGVA